MPTTPRIPKSNVALRTDIVASIMAGAAEMEKVYAPLARDQALCIELMGATRRGDRDGVEKLLRSTGSAFELTSFSIETPAGSPAARRKMGTVKIGIEVESPGGWKGGGTVKFEGPE